MPVAKAQDHLKYLRPECVSISEAIRTGPARGVRSDVVQSLHEEYRRKCSFDDQEARKQVIDDNKMEWQSRIAQRDVNKAARQQAAANSDHCFAMRDAVSSKRKRHEQLDPQETMALRDLERAYNERCIVNR